MSEKIFAEVNGKKITQSTVQAVLSHMDPRRASQFQSPEGQKYLLDELVRQELIYADAIDNKLEEEEEFIKSLEKAKEEVLKQYALSKLLGSIKAEDAELLQYYEQKKSLFGEPESAKASHILVDTEQQANEILSEIKEGLSFEEAAQKHSKCPSKAQGGDLGFFTRGKMVPEFEDATFKMQLNDISEPVKTQFGYHLILLKEKKAAQQKSFEEVKNSVYQQMITEKQNAVYMTKTEELKKKYSVKMMA